MSALGHKRTPDLVGVMSALPPKADIVARLSTVIRRYFFAENALLHSLWSSLERVGGKRFCELAIRENDSVIGNEMREV